MQIVNPPNSVQASCIEQFTWDPSEELVILIGETNLLVQVTVYFVWAARCRKEDVRTLETFVLYVQRSKSSCIWGISGAQNTSNTCQSLQKYDKYLKAFKDDAQDLGLRHGPSKISHCGPEHNTRRWKVRKVSVNQVNY
jgi:hypothetical protein